MPILHHISYLDAHKRLLVSLGVAGLTAVFLYRFVDSTTLGMIVWLVYTLVYLGLTWITILTAHPRNLRSLSVAQDTSRTLSFVFVILCAFASLAAVVILFKSGVDEPGHSKNLHVSLAGLVVLSSWFLVHTVFTLRYAHLFYDIRGKGDTDNQQKVNGELVTGGLDFPADDAPDYLDFAYFSFIIGMTSQVSDVAVQSKTMRRIALIHGILAFFFNTSIIALSINTLSNVLQTK